MELAQREPIQKVETDEKMEGKSFLEKQFGIMLEKRRRKKVILICSVSLNSLSQLNVYSHLVFKHSETDNKRQSA